MSVVIISLNSERTIGECLKSLGDQSALPREVLVVDGGSEDGTTKVLDEIKRGVDLPLRVIADNGGNRATSRNIGLRSSSGEIVAFLDADCIAPRDWIRSIESSMSSGQSREVAVAGPYVPAQETRFAKATYHLLGETTGKLASQFMRREDRRRYVKTILGGNCAFTRELLLGVNGFDERLNWLEDVDLSNRIRASGARIAFIPELYVLHRWTGWNGLRSLVRSSAGYGRNRAVAARIKPSLSPRGVLSFYLAFAIAFLALVGCCIAYGVAGYLAIGLLVLYLSACVLVMSSRRSLDVKATLSPLAFFIAYGAGLLEGSLKTRVPAGGRWGG